MLKPAIESIFFTRPLSDIDCNKDPELKVCNPYCMPDEVECHNENLSSR